MRQSRSQRIFFNQILQNDQPVSIVQSRRCALNDRDMRVGQSIMKQQDVKSFQLKIDNEIYRLKREKQKIEFDEIKERINNQFNTTYTVNDLINRWEMMERPTKEVTIAIFNEFQKHEIDLVTISEKTGIAITRVKREIVACLVNNIFKICLIVRKRNISNLKSNFISKINIKNLVVIILKAVNFRNVKEEYSMLWNFISHYYDETHFKSVADETYKFVYRELIILAEKYKINDMVEEGQEVSFQRKILEQSHGKMAMADLFALYDHKKKNNRETIDLISDQQGDNSNQNEAAPAIQLHNDEPKDHFGLEVLKEKICLYHRMRELENTMYNEDEDTSIREEMAQIAFKITYLDEVLNTQ